MIDHLSLGVNDLAKSRAFYEAALKPLGFRPVMEFPGMVGFGPSPEEPRFWIGRPDGGRWANACPGSHVCFEASSRALVDAFHRAARRAGGRDNGKPGLRPEYHPHYYGGFIIDPDGHHIEAACHQPAAKSSAGARAKSPKSSSKAKARSK
jgi:catechol 2,3-dioxygenase-like lactoylglutathione lyase family enzyme